MPYNNGPKTMPVAAGADIREYLLVDFRSDGKVRPFVADSGEILMGSTVGSSENDYVPVQLVNAEGTRYLKLDNSESITVGALFTNGATAGTIKVAGDGENILGYCLEAATSGAATFAVVECVLNPSVVPTELET